MKQPDSSRACIPTAFRPKPIHLLVLLALTCWQLEMQASQAGRAEADAAQNRQQAPVQFDSSFLQGIGAVDLSRFAYGNTIAAGSYLADIYINGNMLQRSEIRFTPEPGQSDAQPCLDKPLLQRAGVDISKAADAADPACLRLSQVIPGGTTSFDLNTLQLNLSVPQAMMLRAPRGYVDPEHWDAGVPVGMLGYRFNTQQTQVSNAGSRMYSYLGLAGGANYGRWYFRHNGSLNWGGGGRSSYQNISTYVQRDITDWSSRLLIGDTYTDGELMDSTAFRGVRLHTDDRMLPDSLRGYAPVVRGIANTNARVSIFQNGIKLHETTVAPGAFVIDDLYSTGYGGDLQVRITEADGSVRTFAVPYAAVPRSLREGMHRYSLTAGTVRHLPRSSPPFLQGNWQYGFSNMLTGYGGASVAKGYLSATAGAALTTGWGAFGLDLTHSSTKIAQTGSHTGQSIRASYAKSFAETGTSVGLAAYRYSTSGFFGLNDAMQARDRASTGMSSMQLQRLRNRLSLTTSQRLGEHSGYLSATASVAKYWNGQGNHTDFTLGYTGSAGRMPYNLSASRQRDAWGRASTLLYVGFSIPLETENTSMVSSSLSRDSRGGTRANTSVSGMLDTDGRMMYGLNADYSNADSTSSANGGGNIFYSTTSAQFQASASVGKGYRQIAAGASGAIVAHPGGITLSQPLSETFGIVQAQHAEGASINNVPGVKVDSRGYAIVPNLTAYRMNQVSLDPKGISTDVQLQATSQNVAPLAGAAPLIVFKTNYSRSAVVRVRHLDGTPLPFGAIISDQEGNDLGVVGQAGKLLVRGLKDQGELQAHWGAANAGDQSSSSCSFAYTLPARNRSAGDQSLQNLDAACMTLAQRESKSVQVAAAQPPATQLPAQSATDHLQAPGSERDFSGLRLSASIRVLVPEKTASDPKNAKSPVAGLQPETTPAGNQPRDLKIDRKLANLQERTIIGALPPAKGT